MSFIFGGNTGKSPEQVAREREIANALLMNAMQQPKDVGSGLNAIGQALAYRALSGRADAAQRQGQESASKLFGSLFPDMAGQSAQAPAQPQVSPSPSVVSALTGAQSGQQPRGIRNNNPGNIEYGKFAQSRGATGTDGRFAQFGSPQEGVKAIGDLLGIYQDKHGINTIRGAINRWAPSSENNSDAYVQAVSKAAGIAPDAQVNFRDPAVQAKVIPAIIKHENGMMPYGQDVMNAQAPAQPQQQMAQASPQGSPSITDMLQFLQTPWADPAQKDVVKTMLKQALESRDPKYQAELTRLQQQMRNDTPEARLAYEQQLMQMRQGDPKYQAEIARMQQQSAKDQAELAAGQRKLSLAQQQQEQKANLVGQEIDRAINLIDNGGSLMGTTGMGSYASAIPGTDARTLAGLLDTIKANIGFDQLNQMRAASPTGGALGNVTENELKFLQSVAGKLDQSGNPQVLKDNLNRYYNALMDAIHGPGQGPDRRPVSFDQNTQSNSSPKADALPKPGDIVDGYRFKGGDPSDRNNWEAQ